MAENEQTSQEIQSSTIICKKCQHEQSTEQKYCTNCGEPLTGTAKKSVSSSGSSLGSLVDDQHRKHIKSARIAIMVVAILTIIAAIFFWFSLESEIDKVRANPMMVVKQDVVAQARLEIGIMFALGIVFLCLYFWAKTNPFAAVLTALILYITNIIVAVGIEPTSLARGIIVKIIIIAVLANGLKSALAYKKEKEIAAQNA